MARQFRSDDSSKWFEGFGNGGAGTATITGTYGAGTGGYIGACSGTSGQYTLTTPNGWGVAYGGWICLIHQTQGTGAGNWELNRIMSFNSTTATLKYPLQNSYTTGAQCILAIPYKNLTIGDLALTAWDGSTGGVAFFLDQGTTTISGTINGTGKGFRGGAGYTAVDGPAYTGEGSGAGSTRVGTADPAGNGGGQNGIYSAGGGNVATMTSGSATGSADYHAELITAGCGGGGGGGASSNGGTAGGNGGSFILFLSRFFNNAGAISNNGADGVTSNGNQRAGSGGAGGCTLIKAQTAVLGTITASGGAAGAGNPSNSNNTAGSAGRNAIDYVVSSSGSTTPALGSARQDLTLRQPSKRRIVI